MKVKIHWLVFTSLLFLTLVSCVVIGGKSVSDSNPGIRVPAEWETHAATWMQWPKKWESDLRPAFAKIINVVQDYEPVHLLTSSKSEKKKAQQFLSKQGITQKNITWHIAPTDNAWLRDNGPIYVTDDTNIWIQNWKFDGWGGNFGEDVEYESDNLIPGYIGKYLGIAVENHQDYVLEKGNLEFNGTDTLVLNWDCQDDRNPGITKAEHEQILKQAFGDIGIIWAYGHDPQDWTIGHIDGTARFVDRDTLVVTDYYGSSTEQNLVIAAEEAGLAVIRYSGDPNWLVGNGFVAAMAAGDNDIDAELKLQLESLFPNRDVYMIDARAIAANGGGIHCVTNDQPALNYSAARKAKGSGATPRRRKTQGNAHQDKSQKSKVY